jgi:hypothetical protein
MCRVVLFAVGYVFKTHRGTSIYINLEEPGYPAQPGLIRLSVRPSVHTCRLGVQRKMAQAQQIRSIILQNHESTM